jgi:hypothetical protein
MLGFEKITPCLTIPQREPYQLRSYSPKSGERRKTGWKKAIRSENEPYLFRINSVSGGNRTRELTRLVGSKHYIKENF